MQYTGYELLWLFLGSMIYATSLEWIAGHLIERYYHESGRQNQSALLLFLGGLWQ